MITHLIKDDILGLMSEQLGDLLAKRKPSEPTEFAIIRTFVQQRYNIVPSLALQGNTIIISMPNSASAGSLRFDLHTLSTMCKTTKRLMIRIGN